jgi:phage-related protein (TIGR01555 family)
MQEDFLVFKNIFRSKKKVANDAHAEKSNKFVFENKKRTVNLFEKMNDDHASNMRALLKNCFDKNFQKSAYAHESLKTAAIDSGNSFNQMSGIGSNRAISETLLNWFGSLGFIGYQLCAIISQHWLIDKACTIPGKDAIRNGYSITVNDGKEIDLDQIEKIKQYDCDFNIAENCIQFVRMSRIFGIRIAMFVVETDDPIEYYANPFNIDGIMPGSYKGISQIDPYWITPELDIESSADPSSMHFYEPTWWRVKGMRVHRSHLVINIPFELPDILKPSYMYGGISLVQKIYERVYAAERTANEAPLLAMTKRTGVLKVDMDQVMANQGGVEERIQNWILFRDNYGEKLIGTNEDYSQLDTSLADLDAVIMTQYQIVSGISNIPISKLLGITLKGFNSSGDYEEKSYHEEIKSIQTNELSKLIKRHHDLVMKSYIDTKGETSITITWNPLSMPSDEELANLNKLKAETASLLASVGAIDSVDERNRIIADQYSGYNGIEEKDEDELDDLDDEEFSSVSEQEIDV